MDKPDPEASARISHRRRLLFAFGLVALLAVSATLLARWNRGDTSNELVVYGKIDVREVEVALNESDVDRQLFLAVPRPELSSRENSRSRLDSAS